VLKELVEYYECAVERTQLNSHIDNSESDFYDGYSHIANIEYKIVLRNDGTLKDILPYNNHEIFPFRFSVSSTSAEYIDHRGKYIFGVEWNSKQNSFKLSIEAFEKNKEVNLHFLSDIDTPIANAYKLFLQNWNPENELENPVLLSLGKNFSKSFCVVVEGFESSKYVLHRDAIVKKKWEEIWSLDTYFQKNENFPEGYCSVSGKRGKIPNIHFNLTSVGGNSGSKLVSFKKDAFWSYGKKESINSSISLETMKKYVQAFNYLNFSQKNHLTIDDADDMTLFFWANTKEKEAPYLEDFLCELFEADVELEKNSKKIGKGKTIDILGNIDENIEFCILGVKPNSSRLAIKIFEKDSFGNIMSRIAKHQEDMRLGEDDRQISLNQIINELKSTVSRSNKKIKKDKNNDIISPDLSSKLLTAILNNRPYPEYLLQTVVRRVKVDKDIRDENNPQKIKIYSISEKRARIIKACLVRSKYYKGDEYMIDSKNQTDAFRCGRLFAVLERIQIESLKAKQQHNDTSEKDTDSTINSTIRERFFTSACSTPKVILGRLINLSQHHLSKLNMGKYIAYEKLLQDIMVDMTGFPEVLSLKQQGDFVLGYYQQKQTFFISKNKTEGEDE